MIIEFFINCCFGIINSLFSILPDFEWNVDEGAIDTFFDIIGVGCYLLPMKTVIAIFSLICAIMIFRIIVAIIKTIWDLLPIL